jgi:hypothetical protein
VFTHTTNVLRTQWYLQVLRMLHRTQWCLQILRIYLELNGVYKYYECTWNSMVLTSTTHVPRTQWYLQVLRMYLELNVLVNTIEF